MTSYVPASRMHRQAKLVMSANLMKTDHHDDQAIYIVF